PQTGFPCLSGHRLPTRRQKEETRSRASFHLDGTDSMTFPAFCTAGTIGACCFCFYCWQEPVSSEWEIVIGNGRVNRVGRSALGRDPGRKYWSDLDYALQGQTVITTL